MYGALSSQICGNICANSNKKLVYEHSIKRLEDEAEEVSQNVQQRETLTPECKRVLSKLGSRSEQSRYKHSEHAVNMY